jgi:hypothetical protein
MRRVLLTWDVLGLNKNQIKISSLMRKTIISQINANLNNIFSIFDNSAIETSPAYLPYLLLSFWFFPSVCQIFALCFWNLWNQFIHTHYIYFVWKKLIDFHNSVKIWLNFSNSWWWNTYFQSFDNVLNACRVENIRIH